MSKRVSNKRDLILAKSGGKCWYCGCHLNGARWQADHFYPVIRVGKEMRNPEFDNFENMVPSCAPCNNFKSSSDIEGMRFRINEQFDNVPNNSVGMRQLMRLGLVEIERKPVTFWFEREGLVMPTYQEIGGYHPEAHRVLWKTDNGEPNYYSASVGKYTITLRQLGTYWIAIAIDDNWDSSRRIEIPNGHKIKEQAASWALSLTANQMK
ncbi:HNH nuclease [Vibrio phage 1.123.O._10N.286.48.F3]|nr:HNH nuclease [Vibrio phage 1.123.O._10N.286.48.F3]